jgi:hypothetical protein
VGAHGRPVQVDPIKPTLKAPGSKRLKLKSEELLSSFAFNFNLRPYIMARVALATELPPEVFEEEDPPDRTFEDNYVASMAEVGPSRFARHVVDNHIFAVCQGTSNGGQRSSNRKTRICRPSDLPCNGTTWLFDRHLRYPGKLRRLSPHYSKGIL